MAEHSVITQTWKSLDNKVSSISGSTSVCPRGMVFLVFNITHCWEVRNKHTVFFPVIVIALDVSSVNVSFLEAKI